VVRVVSKVLAIKAFAKGKDQMNEMDEKELKNLKVFSAVGREEFLATRLLLYALEKTIIAEEHRGLSGDAQPPSSCATRR